MARTSITNEAVTAALAETPLFRPLREATRAALAEQGLARRYRQNTYLFHEGEEATRVFVLVEGEVEIASLSSSAQLQLHTTLEPPALFGELGVLGDVRRTATARAVSDSMAWSLEGAKFLDLVVGEAELAKTLMKVLVNQLTYHEGLIQDLLFLDVRGRVAKRLLELSSTKTSDERATPAITQAALASLCGASRENVTRVLSELQTKGAIERRGRRYLINDEARLKRLSEP